MKHKPWIGYKESVFDGDEGSVDCDLSKTPKEVKSQIVAAFEAYFRNPDLPTYGVDDPFHRAVDDATLEMSPLSEVTQHSILDESDLNGLLGEATRVDNEDCDFETAATFTRRSQFHDESEVDPDEIDQLWRRLSDDPGDGVDRPRRHLSDFDASDVGYRQQRDAVAVFLKCWGCGKMSVASSSPPSGKATFAAT